ncbi:hypothetical protein ACFPM0_36525 [Pseudonocardia sulfidoxydans]
MRTSRSGVELSDGIRHDSGRSSCATLTPLSPRVPEYGWRV